MAFNLNTYEFNCYHHNYEAAIRELISLLRELDNSRGKLSTSLNCNSSLFIKDNQLIEHNLSRIVSATTFLFLQKEFNLNEVGINQMIYLQRWLEIIFATSPFRNADHIIQGLNQKQDPNNPIISQSNLAKFAMFYLPDSNIPLNFEELWKVNKTLTTQLCFALLSPRFLATPNAHEKREFLLKWLPDKLYELESLDNIPISILHDVYMHCSYADQTSRHSIKRPLNYLIRKQLENANINDLRNFPPKPQRGEKPKLLVLLEWFFPGHSIYRTHSRCIKDAKKYFHVVGIGLEGKVSYDTLDCFDEYFTIEEDLTLLEQVEFVKEIAESIGAHVFYMPSIGMFLNTIFMTVLRIAPLQVIGLGHPATTNSDWIDYAIVEGIFVGDDTQKLFSEELLKLPETTFYRPSIFSSQLQLAQQREVDPEVVQIAMCATVMKFNPSLLEALKEIIKRSSKKIHFNFLIGQAIGLTYIHVKNIITQSLGVEYCTVYEHQNYFDYMNIINQCHMFINPFPFGNTNGLVDTVSAGLPGVCKRGEEVFERIDEGLFKCLGFPEWTIADTVEDYIKASLRMIENPLQRYEIAKQCTGLDQVQKLFGGDSSSLGKILKSKLDAFYTEDL